MVMAMKRILFLYILVVAKAVLAWNSVAEMESDICVALTNDNRLVSAAFIGQLGSATNSASIEMKTEAHLLLSISAYQNFLQSADDKWLYYEMNHASNAVMSIGNKTNTWQYWMARFSYASAQISVQQFADSHSTLTNALMEMFNARYVNGSSAVERAILHKYEMPDLGIEGAMKVFAGMTAAQLGIGNVATNYANQVPSLYRNKIIDFLHDAYK